MDIHSMQRLARREREQREASRTTPPEFDSPNAANQLSVMFHQLTLAILPFAFPRPVLVQSANHPQS